MLARVVGERQGEGEGQANSALRAEPDKGLQSHNPETRTRAEIKSLLLNRRSPPGAPKANSYLQTDVDSGFILSSNYSVWVSTEVFKG